MRRQGLGAEELVSDTDLTIGGAIPPTHLGTRGDTRRTCWAVAVAAAETDTAADANAEAEADTNAAADADPVAVVGAWLRGGE